MQISKTIDIDFESHRIQLTDAGQDLYKLTLTLVDGPTEVSINLNTKEILDVLDEMRSFVQPKKEGTLHQNHLRKRYSLGEERAIASNNSEPFLACRSNE